VKKLVIACLIFVPLAGSFAQEKTTPFVQGVSVFLGGAWSRYAELPAVISVPELGRVMGTRFGAVAGVLWEFRFGRRFLLDNGLQYARRGAAVDWNLMGEPLGTWDYRLDVIGNPITVRFKPWPRSSPYILGGYELSLIVAHRLVDRWPASERTETNIKGDTHDLDFGLIAGAGAEIPLGNWTMFSEVRYYHGLLDISNGTGALEPYPVIKSRSLMVLAGVRFKLRAPEEL